jgi:fumarate hydratase subunit alpha
MKDLFVSKQTLFDMMYNAMVMAAAIMPSDAREAILQHLEQEESEIARMHLATTVHNCELAEEEGHPICPDIGWPLFFVKAGDQVSIEGGFSTLYEVSKAAVEKATSNARLKPTMVHPITRVNPGNYMGNYLQILEIRFDPSIDYLDVIAILKGGGSEVFGTFYRMMYPSDGKKGIMKFILDCLRESTFAGKTCPPNIIGIGIGGTADICTRIAKEAAILRPIGSRHPEQMIAEMEDELVEVIRSSGIGPMGMGGGAGVLDVHIEYAMTHTAGLPVAFDAQCCVVRRKVARLSANGGIKYLDFSKWEYR